MPLALKKGELRLSVEKAGEKYRGTRFDRNGTVVSARFRGKELLSDEKPRFRRDRRRFGRGLHNEFGILRAVGYDEISPGGWFPKIGVGWLQKDALPYTFYRDYVLDPISFEVAELESHRALFRCVSGERNGYAYEYQKEIVAGDGEFTVRYRLENCGSKRILTDEYSHNFLLPGGAPMGSRYRLEFPWSPRRDCFDEFVDPEGRLSLTGGTLTFKGPIGREFFIGGLANGVGERDGLTASWTLRDVKTGLCLRESGSFIPTGVNLWGHRGVISPELFFSLALEGGDIVTWERRFQVWQD